jgi:hypothetical protein
MHLPFAHVSPRGHLLFGAHASPRQLSDVGSQTPHLALALPAAHASSHASALISAQHDPDFP